MHYTLRAHIYAFYVVPQSRRSVYYGSVKHFISTYYANATLSFSDIITPHGKTSSVIYVYT